MCGMWVNRDEIVFVDYSIKEYFDGKL